MFVGLLLAGRKRSWRNRRQLPRQYAASFLPLTMRLNPRWYSIDAPIPIPCGALVICLLQR